MTATRFFFWKTPVSLAICALGTFGSHAAWAQCAGGAPAPGASAAQIVALAGQGQTRAPGVEPWSTAALSQQLAQGADVRTLALSSAALLLADRTQIRMSANAQLRLCESQPERTLLELAAGRLWARTKKTPAALQLQTPAALAVVRGTDWDVEVDTAGRTTLTVLSGQVELSNAQGSVQLGPAEQGYVEPGQAPIKRLLVRPRERVQWVTAYPGSGTRWAEGAAAADLVLADQEVAGGQLDAAQARLEQAWRRTQDPRAAARRAELLMAQDRGADARAWLDATRAAAPASVELLLADADWHRLEGRGDAALALYREAVARTEGSAQQAAAHWGLGRALHERGDLHAARVELARAVELAPDNPTYRGEQSTAATEALRLSEARAGFDAALAQAGDDYVSLAGAGLLALKQGDPEAARTQLLKALVIEPRYAQAHIWLAVAEYQLGGYAAAFDSLERARVADPNDPVPWQVESILRNDSGEPEAAIAAAREALTRLPYLKSMNPLASDSQGSANLGKALGDFGLEHWARAYAQQSYYPLWAGSHFFMANRYESSYSRNSELYQGYLADPLAFGASEKQAVVLPITGSEWLSVASAQRGPVRDELGLSLAHTGLAAAPMPVAWRARVEGFQMEPRAGTGSYRMSSPGLNFALGVRPTDRLSLFLLHVEEWIRYAYPGGRVLGEGVVFDSLARQRSRRTDVGGTWRWSADEQTWFKFNRGFLGQKLVLDDARWGPQDSRIADEDDGVMLRHTVRRGGQTFSAGWERVGVRPTSSLGDALVAEAQDQRVRFDAPWAAFQSSHGPWTWHAQASWPRLDVRWHSRFYDSLTGEDLSAPVHDAGGFARRALPGVGLSYRLGPGRALHAAYIESMRSPASHSLAPMSVGAIPIDHQYQLSGSFARKSAVQLDWEWDARTFGFAALSRQDIANPTYGDGSLLFSTRGTVELDKAGTLTPVIQTAATAVDPYNGVPVFDRGRLHQASFALNRVLAPRWSGLVAYTWAHARNTGSWYAGNALPGFARHTLALASVWQHGARDFSTASLVYRSSRFSDEANLRPEAAGWNLFLTHSVDSADRRWSLAGTAQTPLDGRVKPTFWLRVRYRD